MNNSAEKLPADKDPILTQALEKAAIVNPEFDQVFGHYSMYVPEFSDLIRNPDGKDINYGFEPRAAEEIKKLIFDEKGMEIPERRIRKNVRGYVIKIRAKLRQLVLNPEWLGAFENHETKEDDRLQRAKNELEAMGKPNVVTDLIRRRFIASASEKNSNKVPLFVEAARTKIKMVEEVLVWPTERLIYPEIKNIETEQKIIANLVIDPEMITDTLLRNLGLEEYIAAKNTKKIKRLTKKAEAIPEIKKRLGKLQPILNDSEYDQPLTEGYCRYYITADGYLLGTSNGLKGKHLFRINLVDGINRFRHIQANQSHEIEKLRYYNKAIKGIDDQLGKEWHKIKGGEEINKIKATLIELVKGLKLVNNKLKKQMLEALETCVTLETVYARRIKDPQTGEIKTEKALKLNPGAQRAKMVNVHGNIAARIIEIEKISGFLSKDRIRLETIKADHDLFPFASLKNYIEDKAKEKRSTGESFLSKPEQEELINKLNSWVIEFNTSKTELLLEPYRCFVMKILAKIGQAQNLLNREKPVRKELAELITQIYLITKLQDFWSRMQSLYEKNLSGENLPYFVELGRDLRELKRRLLEKMVARNIKTSQFDDIFHQFYKLLEDLIKLADEGRGYMKKKDQQREEDKALEVKKEMYKLVAKVNIVDLINKIE